MAYTTTNLLDAVEVRTFAPAGQTTLTNAEILTIADEETKSLIVPELQGVRKEYFVTYKDYTVTASQEAYDIPVRAVGLSVREVKLVDSAGSVQDLEEIAPEDIETTNSGVPEYFYLKDNQVCLYPKPASTSGTLRIYYVKRPAALVETSAAGTITAIDTGSNTVTLNNIPATWSTSNTFDLIRKDGGHETRAIDQSASAVSSTTITFSSTLPTALAVGDYVALSGESPVVQLPDEYRTVLVQAVARGVLESMRLPGAKEATEKLEKMLEQARKTVSPRTQGSNRKFKPPRF